ncbi:hypothetical protein GE061_011517 [Apolygus lucorum]|uniref:Mediator of RNA polymerase II transcription subunit 1 n=1 Tax=Apolygus lucorum TaxID=248454 RepID=A0A8S9Y1R2_APOLU|nr:hypothetical protein GE061_011517 [Apolygus lucorum]
MEGSILTSVPLGSGSGFGLKEKSKEWQMEMLMEKLRSKSSQFKSFYESSKALRMTMLEKRYPIDSTERSHLQKCLDTLQQNIKVTTLQAMIERLESVSRQLGLKFVTGPTGMDLFISSDMFYLEVTLESSGGVKDVKIHHDGQGGQQSCEELVACLGRRDFADFTAQLEGLASIYQINAEKKVKCKAFTALTSLEVDLTALASLHPFSKDTLDLVQHSPVGFLEKRRGGHPMKLTYFVAPYELLDPTSRARPIKALPPEGPLKVGTYVSVCMESSSANKLQIQPLVTAGRGADGSSWPVYAPLGTSNSISLAGSFVLTLNKPMPICISLINSISAVTQVPCADLTTTYPLLNLICQHSGNGTETSSSKELFVNVDDQHHCYLMTESRGLLDGVVVSSIPFTHPSHVPEIIGFLRRQAMFNCIIASCVRPNTKVVDFEKMTMVEVTPLSWRQLSVSLEHPLEESMASVELDLTDPDHVQVKVFTSSTSPGQYSELATKVFQRCLSIPVTMRTLIKQWNAASQQQQHRMMYNGGIGGSGLDPSGGPGGGHDRSDPRGDGPPDLLDPEVTVKLEPGLGQQNYGDMLSDHQQPPSIPDPVFDSSFSSPLDHDLTLGGISFGDLPGKSGLALGGILDTALKPKKKKRKASDVGWNSPKRKAGDDGDSSGDDDSTSLGTPTSREANDLRAGTPTSATSGLEFSALADLENSVSGMTGGDKTSDNELEEVMMAATGEIDDTDDVFKSNKKKKLRSEKERTANDILMDLENKNLVPPSVSITPIVCGNAPNFGSVLSGMGLDRRPGIEIIPITTSPPAPVPTSITITPIPKSSDERSKDRKKSREGEKSGSKTSGSEKKRKRKREESPMGPPEKLPPKNDPLSKRVTVSIEPAESSPSSPVSAIRKFTSSPTGGSSTSSPLAIIPKGSPGPSKSSKSSHQSPKHSPAYSPKNNLISSPKTHSSSSAGSPKSSGSSVGKPSLSTMKSAVSSPSKEKSKSSSSSSSKSSSGSDKSDRKSPKMKTSSVKSSSRSSTSSPGGGPPSGSGGGDGGGADSAQSGGTGTPAPSGGSDLGKASSSNSTSSSSRNRKGSLSAIVDKLKSAQAGDELSVSPHREKDSSKKDRDKKVPVSTAASVELKASSSPAPGTPKVDGKSGEYMVKHSSDGMKITINKTKTRDKLREKVHTGLKPGVSSGPISKKPSSSSSSNSGTVKSGTSSTSSSYKKKTESTSSSGSKPPKDKLNKSSSSSSSNTKDKVPASGSSSKKDALFTVVETGLVKALDTKFQIPKLSARTSVTAGDSSKKALNDNPPPSPSPSVSVHIVPSRLSPRRSPGVITDDDLMDEALVGGK